MIYVDDSRNRFGRMMMCHMFADTTGELLNFVDRLGISRRWIQKQGKPEEHFDICMSKRKLAISFGAKAITKRDAVAIVRRKRRDQDSASKK